MAGLLPKSIVLRSVASGSCAYYMNDNKDVLGFVRCGEDNVFNPFAKINVESSKFYSNYVHLIFPHSNKYWGRYGPDSKYIVASLDKPEENTSKLTCTLFEPSIGDDKYLYFTHVQSGWRVGADLLSSPYSSRVYVDEKGSASSPKEYAFTFLDWGTLVKLPKFITFVGDNGNYLKVVWYDGEPWKDGRPYLQFSGDDFNHEFVAYEVDLYKDGHIRFKSAHVNKYWRRSSGTSSWILADSTDEQGNDNETLFWPVKIDDRTIALRSAGNKNFCKRFTHEGKVACLSAEIHNITKEARLVVQELVLERTIYNVRYRMEDARVYNEKPFVAGIGSATNDSDTESTLAITVSYTETTSSTFTYTLSVEVGVKASIETGIPFIAEGEIEVSASVTNSFEWGKTIEASKKAEAVYTAKVPAKSRVTVNYIGTEGKCSVPFSYTQRDKRSSDGSIVTSNHIDGIFYGVNYYSFRFEQLKVESL